MLNKILLAAGVLFAASMTAQTSVTVSTSGIDATGKGKMVALLFSSAEGFPREQDKAAFRLETAEFQDEVTFTFPQVPPGEYAIILFQDLNANGAMDTNFIGYPREPLGLAGMTAMGRPSFSKVKVEVGHKPVTVDIKMLNQ
ncbi:DUF2141 domain-containing protein [Lewinella sp. 4G2]|uniref:DUF2141 domain-containing protein n=1 Tax=Lewinella sp. 4G2 TaxID=1803372 RepID=UPI0007B47452|nr:DUF2141 domain-containing protein [Lewinella sp. 4G2]OAV44049.1 hypothetical protein A3850_005860 [Lewinella sp. 4G2]